VTVLEVASASGRTTALDMLMPGMRETAAFGHDICELLGIGIRKRNVSRAHLLSESFSLGTRLWPGVYYQRGDREGAHQSRGAHGILFCPQSVAFSITGYVWLTISQQDDD